MNRIAIIFQTATNKTGWICGLIASIMMFVLVLLTVADVFLRYFFDRPIIGSFELTEYLLVLIVFFSIPWAAKEDINVRVDLLTRKLIRRVRARVYAVSCIFSIAITFLLARYTIPQFLYVYRLKTESDMLEIPAYPFYLMVAIGFFILLFVLLSRLIQYIDEAAQ